MSLTTCLKKVGSALAAEDKAAVLARAGVLRAEGLSATDAGRQAVDERLAEVAGQIGKIQPLVPEVDSMLPDGWAKSENGFTKRAVYRKNQGIGQPFAVVADQGGMAFEVEIRHGDKVVEQSRVVGARSEAIAKADAMLTKVTETGSTHKDPGQPAEPATAAVVKESLAKAAENRNRKPSEMRRELLAMIDAKLPDAVDEFIPEWKEPTSEAVRNAMNSAGVGDAMARKMLRGMYENRVAEIAERIGHVTFKVPGDGTFKVLNTRQRLEEFRKKVEKSPGFKDTSAPDPVARTGKYGEPFGVERGSSGPKSAIEGMIDSVDPQAAVDYAAARGLVLDRKSVV